MLHDDVWAEMNPSTYTMTLHPKSQPYKIKLSKIQNYVGDVNSRK
jgi:hypothetical protein